MASPLNFFASATRALVGAVGDVNLAGSVGHQMARRQFAHLACSDQVDALALQVAEDLLRQIDGHRGDRYGGRGDRGLGADPLGDGERPGQQRIELRVDRSHGARRGVRLLHLAQDLRLADDHRVQAGGHAKHVPHRIAIAMFVEVLAIGRRIEAVELAQKPVQVGGAVRGARDQFHPVAGGNDHALLDTGIGRQALRRFRQASLGNGEPLPHFDRRGLVIHADDDEVHDAMNLCVRLKLLAAQTPKAMRKAKVARKAARRPRHPEFQRVYSSSMYTPHMTNDSRIFGS